MKSNAKAPWLPIALTLAVVCLTPGASRAQQAAEAIPDGQRIVAVRVVSETGQLLEENPPRIPAQPGTSYQSDAVRESLRQLFLTGRYADVLVEVADVPGGVRLDFVVRRNFYVDIVHVVGLAPPPSESVALAALRLGLGKAYRESVLTEAETRLQEVLAEEGFYEAKIEHQLSPNVETRQMDITIRVTPGRRARIGKLEVQNRTAFSDQEILRRSKLRPGKPVRSRRLGAATERLRKFLVKKGYLGARVTLRRGAYDAQANTLPLELEVSAGARVRAEVTGAKISSGELRKLLPIYQEGAVDEDLLQEGRRNIRDYLERQGYFDANVQYAVSEDQEQSQQVITYQVERDGRQRLAGVDFEGNHYFSSKLLQGRLAILPARFPASGRFSRRLLSDDQDSIRGLYIANGFEDVKVSSEVIEGYEGKEGDLFVRFHIEEGPQTRVAEINVEGNHVFSDDYLLEQAIGSGPGQPFSEFNVTSDRDNILALYYNEGFPEARFDWEAKPSQEPNRVLLTYRITEGPQITVTRVLLSGYEFTKPSVIEDQVQIQPGQPLREGEVVETQRRLYDLGVFSRVAIAPQNPEGTDTAKTLVVQVEEAKRYTLAYGAGIEVQRLGSGGDPVSGQVRASPRGLFEVTRANFLGRAHTVAFKTRFSSLQSRALLSYAAPHLLTRPNLAFLLTGLADRTRDVRTFTSTRYEATVQFEQRPSPYSSFLYRYSFRRVLVDASSLKVSPDQIPLFSQPTKISALGLTWIRERRDDPADATRGNFNTVDFSVAARGLGSSASFLRLFMQNSSFHPLGRGLVFARSTRIGIEEPIGNTTPANIPLPERFFAGGGNSLRGLGLNQAGPRDPVTGFPVGGLAELIFNQELRFPMRLPIVGDRVGGALFYDVGGVFTRANRITLRSSPPAPDLSQPLAQQPPLNYFSHTIGFGFRYATPIGPVRLDLGYQLNAPRFAFCSTTGTVANPSCPAGQFAQVSRLPRFQFFFNIGSIF